MNEHLHVCILINWFNMGCEPIIYYYIAQFFLSLFVSFHHSQTLTHTLIARNDVYSIKFSRDNTISKVMYGMPFAYDSMRKEKTTGGNFEKSMGMEAVT